MDWQVMALVWAGVFAGIWVGAIPGLSGTMAVSLLISFTFSWELNNALALMCGVFVGAVYGGAITAILLNIPGAPAAIATGMEGYPLAQRGEAGKAIGLCTTVSLFAGMVGVAVLACAAPIIANFALKFSPRDFFLLALMGILLIGSIGGGDPIKGIMAGTIGILISMVGMDPSTGELRYTFGNLNLMAGISFVTAMIGLFGISEALTQFRGGGETPPKQNLSKIVPDRDYRHNVFGILMRTYHLMSHCNVIHDRRNADILIEPDGLSIYGNTQLDKGREIFDIGYEAARKVIEQVKDIVYPRSGEA